MNNFLESLLELSKDNPKRNIIDSDYRCQGIGYAIGLEYPINSDRYYNQELLTWHCTDQYVGIYAHYFDNTLIAISELYGRKMAESFYWVSEKLKDAFTDYVLNEYFWRNNNDFEVNDSNKLEKLIALNNKLIPIKVQMAKLQQQVNSIESDIDNVLYNPDYSVASDEVFVNDIDYKKQFETILKFRDDGYRFNQSQYDIVSNLLNQFK